MASTTASQLNPDHSQLLSNQPWMPASPGVTPNFTNPPNHGRQQIIVTSVFLGITMILVLNRVYVKTYIVRRYTWDDLTILVGLVSFKWYCPLQRITNTNALHTDPKSGTVAYYVASVIGIQRGKLGIHGWNVLITQAKGKNTLIPQYLIAILPALVFLFIKLSFFIMYSQIFRPMRWMRICAYLGAILTTLFYVTLTVCVLYFTTPRSTESWVQHSGSSLNQLNVKLGVPQSGVNLAIDVYILVLPIIAVVQLQMAPRHKFGIILIFMTGLLACLCAILSIYYRVHAQKQRDDLWDVISVMTMSLIEMFVGIWCACMPAAGHTYHHHQPFSNSFKQRLRSLYGYLGLGTRKTAPSLVRGQSHDIKTSRAYHEGYASLDATEHSTQVPAKSLQTFIRSAGPNDLDHEGIHLTYELQQTSVSPPPPGDCRWTGV